MKRPDIDRPTQIEISVPLSLRARLDLLLFSELEGRVPYGAYKEFFCDRIREFLSWKRLDLYPYGFPQGYLVAGPKEMIEALESRLKETQHATA